ncbi:YaaC family protein [Streptomyces sp. NPDC048491]|uniref:YaaC family protein n=1 Tax=Streptomyces sp. NPDC048491 TaxID=3157207 RepID=UPI00343F55D3
MDVGMLTGQAWEWLRSSRADPPAVASSGARGKTYVTALEQAWQMFQAASTVGPATRPLLIFYGLSQAGRAIAAAACGLTGEDWRLKDHGIRATGFHLGFPAIEIRTDAAGTAGSFPRVSQLLGSPVWGREDPVRLEDVWDLLPVNIDYPLTNRDRLTPLYVYDHRVTREDHPLLSVPVSDIPDRVLDAATPEALADFLTAYPPLARHHSYVTARPAGPQAPPAYERFDEGGGALVFNWLVPNGAVSRAERQAHLRAMTHSHGGLRYFFPVIAPMTKELHPLMAWWAVLYSLSMLARYEPAQWAACINVDKNSHAVPIERILELAIVHVPVLIKDAVAQVAR